MSLFLTILGKPIIHFTKLDANSQSQICPNCGINHGKKQLSEGVNSSWAVSLIEMWLIERELSTITADGKKAHGV